MNATASSISVNGIIQNDVFLKTILGFPTIYKKSDPCYKSINQKNNCWNKVAEILKVDSNLAKQQFKAIKEKFRREFKYETIKNGDGVVSNPRWSLFSLCQSLFDEDAERSTTTNVSIDTSYHESEIPKVENYYENENLELDSDDADTPSSLSINNYSSSSSLLTKKRKWNQATSTLANIDSVSQDSGISNNKTEGDGSVNTKLKAFANYLVSELSFLPYDVTDEFMDEITSSLLLLKKKRRYQSN